MMFSFVECETSSQILVNNLITVTSHMRHNISYHRQIIDCLLNSLLNQITTQNAPHPYIAGPLRGESNGAKCIPLQMPVMWKTFPCHSVFMQMYLLLFVWNTFFRLQGPVACLPVCYRTTPERPTFQALMDVDNPGNWALSSRLPRIFLGALLETNGTHGNIPGNLTGMW